MSNNKPEMVRNRKKQDQARLQFPDKPTPHGFQMIFEDYSYSKFVLSDVFNVEVKGADGKAGEQQKMSGAGLANKFAGKVEVDRMGDIELPFPLTLTDATGIRVSGFERNFITERAIGTVANLLDNPSGVAQAAMSAAKNTGAALGGIVNGAGSAAEGGQALLDAAASGASGLGKGQIAAMAAYLGRSVIPGDIGKSIGVFAGTAVNPQETLTFSGVDLRQFTFSWDLFPSNVNDTNTIKNIVDFLKRRSLPTVQGVTAGADGGEVPGLSRAFLKYPSVVYLNLLGVNEDYFVRFKPCMISNVTVSYGQGGFVTIMNGGVPNSVSLSITFQEMSIQTADDYPVPKGPSDDGAGGSDTPGKGPTF